MSKSLKNRTQPGYRDETYGVKGFLIMETPAGTALKELRSRLNTKASKPTPARKKPPK